MIVRLAAEEIVESDSAGEKPWPMSRERRRGRFGEIICWAERECFIFARWSSIGNF